MDLARIEALKNEKIFSIPREMAVERNCSCSCACTNDADPSISTADNNSNCGGELVGRVGVLLDRQEDI